jgi:glycosyltransferase involved in cell wall biosynthesis
MISKKIGLHEDVILLEPTSQAVEIIGSSDVFLLPSREDPFPLVMLKPPCCQTDFGFDKTGGCGEFVERCRSGNTLPDVNQMAKNFSIGKKTDEAKAGKLQSRRFLAT